MRLSSRKAAAAVAGLAFCAGAVWAAIRFFGGPADWVPSVPDRHFTEVFEEVMAVENISRPPVPSASGAGLACVRGSQYGRSLFLTEPASLRQTVVPVTNDVRRVAGWSADGRYLAFEQKPPFSERVLRKTGGRVLAEDLNESWLTLLDSRSNLVRRLTTNRAVNEKWFCWLTPKTFFFSSDSDDLSLRGTYWGSVEGPVLKRVSDTLHDFVRISDTKAAYIKEKNIYSFELKPAAEGREGWGKPRIEKVSDFKAGDFDTIRWLRYSPENGNFLFCSRPTNSTWRYLFKLDPGTKALTQLTDGDTYNGQWLEGGEGFAYVGNTNNSFFLAVRGASPLDQTNLFTKGSVANYVVSQAGHRIYATASLGVEPQGIWEYDLARRTLREVVPGSTRTGSVCRWIEPREFRAKSFDGLEIPYFVVAPAELAGGASPLPGASAPGSPRKYPAIIFLPPQTFQFQRSFEARSQLMANVGFYFVAVNYRGCDGYGKAYSELDDPVGAAEDMRAVCSELRKIPTLDLNNLFLWTSSSGSSAAFELLAVAPELWRGAALISPSGWHEDERWRPKQFPAVLFTTGDQDPALPSLKKFKSWASANGVQARFVVCRDSGHITYNSDQVRANRMLAARFFVDHVKN